MTVATRPYPLPPTRSRSLYRLTVEQYHEMLQAGVLHEGDKIEFLEGYLVEKVGHNPPHDSAITFVEEALGAFLPKAWFIRIQSSVTLSRSEPEPDLAVVLAPRRRYEKKHPGPRDIGLVIEVADSTLEDDRELKCLVYARDRLPIYWIVNLPERQVEVYTEPRSGKTPHYRRREVYPETASVTVMIGAQSLGTVPVANLLPSAPAP